MQMQGFDQRFGAGSRGYELLVLTGLTFLIESSQKNPIESVIEPRRNKVPSEAKSKNQNPAKNDQMSFNVY